MPEPYFDNGTVRLFNTDARVIPLPDNSVDCVVTSPPYWGLRDYGLEPSVRGGDSECEHEWAGEAAALGKGRRQIPHGDGRVDDAYADERHPYPAQPPTAGRQNCTRCSAWLGNLGLEPTPELFVEHIVEIFQEVRRVLKPTGTCWLNLGDSYAGGHAQQDKRWQHGGVDVRRNHPALSGDGLKPKDLVGIPWRVAFALQADGWWLRSEITWVKPNPMPESVRDRPTTATEKVFLLTKSAKYWYDAEAVRGYFNNGWSNNSGYEATVRTVREGAVRSETISPVGQAQGSHQSLLQDSQGEGDSTPVLPNREGASESSPGRPQTQDSDAGEQRPDLGAVGGDQSGLQEQMRLLREDPDAPDDGPYQTPVSGRPTHHGERSPRLPALQQQQGHALNNRATSPHIGRNLLNWWPIATQPYPEAHFATFPEALVEPCILAGTSEYGNCPECGTPWERQVTKEFVPQTDVSLEHGVKGAAGQKPMYPDERGHSWDGVPRGSNSTKTTGWNASCSCDGSPAPARAVVLDPFAGSATVGVVAQKLGRRVVLVEASGEYCELAVKRLSAVPLPLIPDTSI